MEWQVFYLGGEVKVLNKQKKHYHSKVSKLGINKINLPNEKTEL